MTDKPSNTWGPFGIISVLVGIAGWFFGDIYSLILGIIAVVLGFVGTRRHQKLCLAGILFGCFALLFVNLLNLGIIPKSPSDKSHLINSINASIRAYEALGNKPFKDKDREKLIGHLRDALQKARLVNIDKVDNQVPGFASHYEDEFITGMESLIEGYEKSDLSKKLKGGLLLDRWAKWNKENRANLGRIKESTLSIISFIGGIITR